MLELSHVNDEPLRTMLQSTLREGLQCFPEVLVRHSCSSREPCEPDEAFGLVVANRVHWCAIDHEQSPLLDPSSTLLSAPMVTARPSQQRYSPLENMRRALERIRR